MNENVTRSVMARLGAESDRAERERVWLLRQLEMEQGFDYSVGFCVGFGRAVKS